VGGGEGGEGLEACEGGEGGQQGGEGGFSLAKGRGDADAAEFYNEIIHFSLLRGGKGKGGGAAGVSLVSDPAWG
jgi:hypothetical protein